MTIDTTIIVHPHAFPQIETGKPPSILTLEEAFPQAALILHMEEHPEVAAQSFTQEVIEQEKAKMLRQRCLNLAASARKNLLELGYLLVEGEKMGLQFRMGYQTMREWFADSDYGDGSKIDAALMGLARNCYQVWCKIAKYGFTHQDIIDGKIDARKEQYIEHIERQSGSRLQEIQQGFIEEIATSAPHVTRLADLPPETRERVKALTNEKFRAEMHEEVAHILETPTPILEAERTVSVTGTNEYPSIVIYDAKFHPKTRTLTGRVSVEIDLERLLALANQGKYTLAFKESGKDEYYTPRDYGRYLRAKYEEELEAAEHEE